MSDIVERLRSSEPLPVCPYDRLSPHYWTAPDDKPCAVCGGLNDPDAPDLCRGADTRIMGEAADEIARLRTEVDAACKRYERLLALFGALQQAAQKVCDETDKNLDTKQPPHRYGAPYGALADLRTLLGRTYGLRDGKS